eukprot:m.92594 g.92594  ORF g.92594 m.92594 type:complete len:77 (-) comp26555_c1_seq3:321-551(-)
MNLLFVSYMQTVVFTDHPSGVCFQLTRQLYQRQLEGTTDDCLEEPKDQRNGSFVVIHLLSEEYFDVMYLPLKSMDS